jgi:enoyl-CoA hydratase/carnithine racemase
MASEARVRVEHDTGVAHLVLDYAPVNQFNERFVRAILEAVNALGSETRALVLSSAVEGIFAAGGDIPWMAAAPIEEQLPFVALCQETYSSLERLACPSIVRAVGQGVARDLLLTGRRISGLDAGAMGVASRVVKDGGATAEALDIARKLADGPAEAIQATKRLAVAASEVTIDEGLARERAEWEQVRRSASSQEGLSAFAEKRTPDFRGAGETD